LRQFQSLVTSNTAAGAEPLALLILRFFGVAAEVAGHEALWTNINSFQVMLSIKYT
jgi:hypothetical protein